MSLKIISLMLLSAVILFKTSNCWESKHTKYGDREISKDDYEDYYDESDDNYEDNYDESKDNHGIFSRPPSLPFDKFRGSIGGHSSHSTFLEKFKAELRNKKALDKKFLEEQPFRYRSPLITPDTPPTPTIIERAQFNASTPETSTEINTEVSIEPTTTEPTKEIPQITQIFRAAGIEIPIEDSQSTTESVSDDLLLPETRNTDRHRDIELKLDSFEERLNKSLHRVFAVLKQIGDAEKVHHPEPKENVDPDLVIGEIFNVPIKLKIEVFYNNTYMFSVPSHAEIRSHDTEVQITWANPGTKNYSIFFGRTHTKYEVCYFGIKTDWKLYGGESILKDDFKFYELTEPLMNIEDEINLHGGVQVKLSTVDHGISLQYIYRHVIGCPMRKRTSISLMILSFLLPVSLLTFLVIRASRLGHYRQCPPDSS